MFNKNTYSRMLPVKTLFRKTQGTMITSPLYRYYNRVFRVVIRSAIVSAISIMGTFRGQFFSSILLFEDVIIMYPPRVAFTYHKNFTFGVYRNLRLDGMTFLLSGIVFLLYPFFRSLSLLFSSIGYDLCKVRTHHKQFLQRRNLLYVRRNPVPYRLTQRRIGSFFYQGLHFNPQPTGIARMNAKEISHKFVGKVITVKQQNE